MSPVLRLSNFEQFAAINVLSDPGAIGGPVIIPQCAQIVLNWAYDGGRTGHNVLYGRYAGAFSGTVAQANAIMTALTTGAGWTGLAGHLATTTSVTGVSIRDVNSANQALINSTNASVPGTVAGIALPLESALVITLRTALAGKANRGRMYISGFDNAAVSAGNIAAAAVITTLQAWANTITAALSGSGYTWVIGQKARAQYTGSTGTLHPARAATSTQIIASPVRDNHWDSQRRRGLK
jgi:hypothetical protein